MTMALAGREFLSYDCQLLLLSPPMNKFYFVSIIILRTFM